MPEQRLSDAVDLDAALAGALGEDGEHGLHVARDVIDTPADRWYGQLAVRTYTSVVDSPDIDVITPAATAIELLRGYTWIRNQSLIQLTEERPHSLTTDPERALLAGDYLYTTAFKELTAVQSPGLHESIDALRTAVSNITRSLARTYTESGPSESDQLAFFDATMGSLGEAATRIGASVASGPSVPDDLIASFGRRAGTARGIEQLLHSDPSDATVVPPALNEPKLQEYAAEQRENASNALHDLISSSGAVSPPVSLATVISRDEPRS